MKESAGVAAEIALVQVCATAAKQLQTTVASTHRQMNGLSMQAQKWRRAAARLSLIAAVTGHPEVRFAMSKIAEGYDRMAHSAEKRYGAYLREKHCPVLGPSHWRNSPLLARWRQFLAGLGNPYTGLSQPLLPPFQF